MMTDEGKRCCNNKIKIAFCIFCLIINIVLSLNSKIYAVDIKETEYTEEYKQWLELSEQDKAKTIAPRKYEVKNNKKLNLFRTGRVTRSALDTDYDLREDIEANVVVRNQMYTGECWAFTGIAVLESNLALRDKLEGRGATVYDFSERHMDYSSATKFLNNEENVYGYRENIAEGGCWQDAEMYLTNGRGAILEKDMPFENNQDVIALSEIQGKTVQTKVEDTVYFESPSNNDVLSTEYKEWQRKVKQHIIDYGGVSTALYWDDIYDSIEQGSYYCNTNAYGTNHLVTIIGWDDGYLASNFTGAVKPTNPGAWIIKNSWGDGGYTLDEFKVEIFAVWPEKMEDNGWSKAEEITDTFAIETLQANGYTYDSESGKYYNDEVKYKYGGYWYVSYEDVLVNEWLYGIKNAKAEVDYNNLYQHDLLGATESVSIYKSSISGEKKVYLANVFNKNTDTVEALNEISIITYQSYKCKVYVNPTGTSKAKKDLVPVMLRDGEYKVIDAGYNTLKFEEPVDITGDNFVVVVEVETANSAESSIEIMVEKANDFIPTVKTNVNESYIADYGDFNNNIWDDMATEWSANLCIKAFTTSGIEGLIIENMPEKTEYIEGSNFESAGMIIMATINGQEVEVTDYEIVNGTNLSLEQTSVTIKYEGQEVQVPITVVEKLQGSVSITTISLNKPYDGSAVATPQYIKVGDGVVTIEWYKIDGEEEIKLETAPINAGNYKVKVILSEGTNYKGAKVEKTFTIEKATEAVTAPRGLTAVEGETLADVELPEGFSFEQELTTSVGNAGENTFTVKYTPADTVNYNEVTGINVTITVTQAERLRIHLGKYKSIVENGINYIVEITSGTKISSFRNELITSGTNGSITVSKNNNPQGEDTNMKTGMDIKIALNNESVTYKAVVKGDITGDGEVTMADVVATARYVGKTNTQVEPIAIRAMEVANVDEKNEVNMADLVKLARYVGKKITEL